jgi:hypothetical protein
MGKASGKNGAGTRKDITDVLCDFFLNLFEL